MLKDYDGVTPKLEVVNPTKMENWDDALIADGRFTFFHSAAWLKVLCESYQYKPIYFARMANMQVDTMIPVMEIQSKLTGRRGVSLPFSDYCEPVVGQEIAFEEAIESVIRHGKKAEWRCFEFRGGERFLQNETPFCFFYEHSLDLRKDEKQLFAGLDSSNRRNIRKAAKMGVQIRIAHSLETMKEFYLLHCLTRKRHGLPPQPFYFFKKIYDHIISRNLGLLVLATYEGRTIAGAVYFHFGRKALYKYGASEQKYQKLRANNLVMWEAIKWYCQNGYQDFSFGRTEPENSGLRRFKKSWGANENVIHYYKYDFDEEKFIADQARRRHFHESIFRRMPMPLLRGIGALLYKHIG